MVKTKIGVVLGLALSLLLAMSLTLMVGCGSKEAPKEEAPSTQTTTPATPSNETAAPSTTPATSSSWDEWKQFLTDYEAWADAYVAFVDKYVANPTDAALSAEYVTLTNESLEFSQKAADVPKDLTPEQTTESTDILLRITQKLNDAAAKLL